MNDKSLVIGTRGFFVPRMISFDDWFRNDMNVDMVKQYVSKNKKKKVGIWEHNVSNQRTIFPIVGVSGDIQANNLGSCVDVKLHCSFDDDAMVMCVVSYNSLSESFKCLVNNRLVVPFVRFL